VGVAAEVLVVVCHVVGYVSWTDNSDYKRWTNLQQFETE